MSVSKIKSALVSAFLEGGLFTQSNIAFENVAFTPGAAPWCKLTFVPGNPTVATLGEGGSDRYDGFMQVDLNFPLNTGDKAAGDMFDAIKNTFTTGRGFLYAGQEAKISGCGRSQGRNENGFFKVPVSIFFYAHVNR